MWTIAFLVLLHSGYLHCKIDGIIKNVSAEVRIVREILEIYEQIGTSFPPKKNLSQPLEVQFGLRLVTVKVDEKNQVVTTSAWARYRWYDSYTSWNPDDYNGITHVLLPHGSIWMPEDLALVNTASTEVEERKVHLQVRYDGRIFYAPHVIYHSGCLIDLSNYPFDIQTCDLWIQSASRYNWDLKLVPYTPQFDLDIYLNGYKGGKEWDVSGNSSQFFDEPRSAGVILMYSRRGALKFTMTLRRRIGFVSITLLVPCFVLSLMIPLIFCLPTERPDRNMLAMSLYGSFVILLLILTENAPPSAASMPNIGKYYCFNMIFIILAVFASVTVISVKGNKRNEPPFWLQRLFFYYLARICCMTSRVGSLDVPKANVPSSPELTMSIVYRNPLYTQPEIVGSNGQTQENQTCSNCKAVREGLIKNGLIREKWTVIAAIMDRMFALLFMIGNIIAAVILLPRPTSDWFNY